MLQQFILLILSIKILQLSANDCYAHLMESPQSYTCSSSGFFTSTDFDPILQNPSKQLTVAITITPTSLCGITSALNFFTVSINTSSGRKNIMALRYDAPNGAILFQTEDSSTVHSIQSRAMTFLGKPFNVYLSANLASGSNQFSVGGLMEDGNNIASSTTLSYGSDWVFDSSLRISVCAHNDGTNLINPIACSAQNFKVTTLLYSRSSIIDFSNSAKIIGDYKLDELKGNTLTNSQGTLGPISLSPAATSPTWVSEVGLAFSSASHFIQIPSFIPVASGPTIDISVSFTFYIRIDSVPTASTPATIFSYYSNTISSEVFRLEINSNMKIKAYIETNSMEGANILVQGQWTRVYMGCIYSAGGLGTFTVRIDGIRADSATGIMRANAASMFSSADTIKIGGGFIGYLRRFQIYSPGAYELGADSCYPSTCSAHIGYSTPPMCIVATCSSTSGTYTSFGTCESCRTGCATCTDATTCQSCDPKYYLSGTSCLKCPAATYTASSTSTTCTNCPNRCTSCTDSFTCQTCSPGYGLYNNLCVLCPARTYLSSDQICKGISETLQDTLTTSQLVNSAATQASSVISQGSAVSLSAAVSGKIFSQIKYLNISYSGELQVALLTWLPSFVSLGLTPNMPESTEEKIPERHVPYVFQKYDVPSSFLINFWENLGMTVFVTVLWLLFKGLEFGFDSKSKAWIISRKARVFIQNFLITALFGVYGDLVLFSLIEYRSFAFGWNLSLLSFVFSLILLGAMFFSFWYQIRLLLNYQKIKNQPDALQKFIKLNEGSQVLFKDMKDSSLAPQLFIFFLSGRDLIFSLILATMFEYPLVQILLFFLLTCLMIAYLLIKRPFESTLDLIQQMFFEGVSFVVSICVLINAILDSGEYIATSSRNSLGKTIIIFNLIFNFGTALFMLFMIFSLLKEAYTKYKQRSARDRKIIKLNNRIQHPSSELKSNNTFDLSQISNQNVVMNLNSEIDFFHQSSLDMGLNNAEFNISHQKLNPRPHSLSKDHPRNSLLHASSRQRIRRPNQHASRKRPLHPNLQVDSSNRAHMNRVDQQWRINDALNERESFKKGIRAQNFEDQ